MAETQDSSRFMPYSGPVDGVRYPIQVVYCPLDICDGWPLEYCEYHPGFEKAKEWAEKNLTDDIKDLLIVEEASAGEGGDKKKRQTRGGKAQIKTKQKQDIEKKITLSRSCRGKKKYVTIVSGLSTYDLVPAEIQLGPCQLHCKQDCKQNCDQNYKQIDLKVASKAFGSRFACGSSVTGDDEIVIQGDVKDDLFEFLIEKWSQIDEDTIEDLGDQKR